MHAKIFILLLFSEDQYLIRNMMSFKVVSSKHRLWGQIVFKVDFKKIITGTN